MQNPFDQTFFKFLLGFSFILVTSFSMIFIVGKYGSSLDKQQAGILSNNIVNKK